MKRCPECGRDYNDDSLSFCLDDGSELLFGPAVLSEPGAVETARLSDHETEVLSPFGVPPSGGSPLESQTRAYLQTTAREAEPPNISGGVTERRSLSAHRAAQPRETAQTSRKPSGTLLRTLSIVGILAALLIGGFFGFRYFSSSDRINSIAVLPFENRSSNADTDYLSDGRTDSLIFRFSQLPNVKVSPTSSVMRYKGKAADVAQVAKELDVDAVLSGRLMQLGDKLDISVQLVDARSGKLIWAEEYDRQMADLLATQREIATTLTQKMQLKLAGNEQGITKKYTNSSEAYQLYMKGRYHYARRVKDDMLKAIDSYQQAIALDPNFALAYAATAEAYNSMGKNPDLPPKECIPLAKAAAMRALEIDPDLPQAHSALGDSLAIYDWNWAESEKHFRRGLELDPNISYSHLAYGLAYLSAMGKTGEVERELKQAADMEPLSMINNAILVTGYIYDRQYDKALAQAKATYELDPVFPLSRYWLGMAHISNGNYDEAIAVSDQGGPQGSFGWIPAVVGGLAYAKTGKRAEAEREIEVLRALAKTRYVRTYYFASIYATLGEKDKAFAELEKSFEDHDCFLGRAPSDPFMDPLRDDPRFKDLMKRMGLGQ
ncbi:MAG TPA: tetratricopeptide repeat protein [Pyrinomonadaceae bacterium]|nr:tetratricopeptide repeat protein [Pyrinomonadaceae bacterium]